MWLRRWQTPLFILFRSVVFTLKHDMTDRSVNPSHKLFEKLSHLDQCATLSYYHCKISAQKENPHLFSSRITPSAEPRQLSKKSFLTLPASCFKSITANILKFSSAEKEVSSFDEIFLRVFFSAQSSCVFLQHLMSYGTSVQCENRLHWSISWTASPDLSSMNAPSPLCNCFHQLLPRISSPLFSPSLSAGFFAFSCGRKRAWRSVVASGMVHFS